MMPLALSWATAAARRMALLMEEPQTRPAWHAPSPPMKPEAECVVILVGVSRRSAPAATRCLHAYGVRGASALCGVKDWCELVPPDEATCPACQTRLGRNTVRRVH